MQPAASRTPQGRHRRPKRSDRVVLGLKISTFLVAAGLIGMVVLLVTDGADNHSAAGRSPAIPKITSSQSAGAPAAPTETSSPVIEAPEQQTLTEEIVATPPPTTTTPTSAPPSQPSPPPVQFAVIGERCDNPGTFSVTREQEPVMCYRSSRGPSRWRRVF
jgi:hypothetical protein